MKFAIACLALLGALGVGCGGESSPEAGEQPAADTSVDTTEAAPSSTIEVPPSDPCPQGLRGSVDPCDPAPNCGQGFRTALVPCPEDTQAPPPTATQVTPTGTDTRLPDAGDRTQVIDKLVAAGLCDSPMEESPGPAEMYYGATPAVGMRNCTPHRGSDTGTIRAIQWASPGDYDAYIAKAADRMGIDVPDDDPFTIRVGDTITIQVYEYNHIEGDDGMTPFEQGVLNEIRSTLGG